MSFGFVLLLTFAAYLLGALPGGVWVSRLLYGIDIREHGNGSASWENVAEVISLRAGAYTGAFDILKGTLAAMLPVYAHTHWHILAEDEYRLLMLSVGLGAVLGHLLSIFNQFRRNLDLSIVIGVVAAIHPAIALIGGIFALLLYRISRNIWMCNTLLLALYPFLVISLYPEMKQEWLLPISSFVLLIFAYMLWFYRRHFQRLLGRLPLSIPRKGKNIK